MRTHSNHLGRNPACVSWLAPSPCGAIPIAKYESLNARRIGESAVLLNAPPVRTTPHRPFPPRAGVGLSGWPGKTPQGGCRALFAARRLSYLSRSTTGTRVLRRPEHSQANTTSLGRKSAKGTKPSGMTMELPTTEHVFEECGLLPGPVWNGDDLMKSSGFLPHHHGRHGVY